MAEEVEDIVTAPVVTSLPLNLGAVIALVQVALDVALALERYDPELAINYKREIARLAFATTPPAP